MSLAVSPRRTVYDKGERVLAAKLVLAVVNYVRHVLWSVNASAAPIFNTVADRLKKVSTWPRHPTCSIYRAGNRHALPLAENAESRACADLADSYDHA